MVGLTMAGVLVWAIIAIPVPIIGEIWTMTGLVIWTVVMMPVPRTLPPPSSIVIPATLVPPVSLMRVGPVAANFFPASPRRRGNRPIIKIMLSATMIKIVLEKPLAAGTIPPTLRLLLALLVTVPETMMIWRGTMAPLVP